MHTAQGQASGDALTLIPLFVGGALALIDPDFVPTLVGDPLGRAMLGSALVLQLVGYLWIWRILKVEI